MKLSPTTQRILTALAAIALLGVGGLFTLWLAARPTGPLAASQSPPPPPESVQLANDPSLSSLLINDDLLTPTGATPLRGLPLNLPLYAAPGVEAVKLAAYQRADGAAGEQVAVCSFKGSDLQAVSMFYNDQVTRLGFAPHPSSEPFGGSGGSGNLIYSRDDQVLLVRVRQAGQTVRLTILLRYTERR